MLSNKKFNLVTIGYFIFVTALIAAIVGFDGTVVLDMTPFRLKVTIDSTPQHNILKPVSENKSQNDNLIAH